MKHLLIALIGFALVACSSDDSFFVSGEILGKPTMNLRAVYYGNDAIQTVITPVKEGKFDFFGSSRTPTLVELYDNDYSLLGRLYLKNGDRVECKIDRNNPYKIAIEGSDDNAKWSAWLNKNEKALLKGDPRSVNSLIKDFVLKNRESVVSSLLILTNFDASTAASMHTADSLLSLLTPEARPQTLLGGYSKLMQRIADTKTNDNITSLTFTTRTDSIHLYTPERKSLSIIAFSNENSGRPDSIVPALRRLHKKAASRLDIVDFSLDTDTFTWARSVRQDTATWTQAWRPGGIMAQGVERLGLPRLPYFIVVDSVGKQLLRTPSITEAEKFINKKIK